MQKGRCHTLTREILNFQEKIFKKILLKILKVPEINCRNKVKEQIVAGRKSCESREISVVTIKSSDSFFPRLFLSLKY